MAKRYEKLSLEDWRKSRSSNASKVLDTKLCNFYVSSPVEFSYTLIPQHYYKIFFLST